MEYSKIIAVTGLPGLHELINSKTDGAIVRSLDDKSTKFVSSRIHNFSHLESIEVYTLRENVNLVEVFNAMDTSGQSLPDEKDAKAIKGYFEKVYPDIDFERVYNSDMKKMLKWFTTLKANNVELKLSEPAPEEPEVTEEAVEVEEEEIQQPKQKAAKKTEDQSKSAKPASGTKKKTAPAKEKDESTAPQENKAASKAAPAAKKKSADKSKDAAEKKEVRKKTPPKKK